MLDSRDLAQVLSERLHLHPRFRWQTLHLRHTMARARHGQRSNSWSLLDRAGHFTLRVTPCWTFYAETRPQFALRLASALPPRRTKLSWNVTCLIPGKSVQEHIRCPETRIQNHVKAKVFITFPPLHGAYMASGGEQVKPSIVFLRDGL